MIDRKRFRLQRQSVDKPFLVVRAGASGPPRYTGTQAAGVPLSEQVAAFCQKNFFLVGMFAAIGFARVAPSLGQRGTWPEYMIKHLGVTLVFLLSGLSLELSQLTRALSNMKLNLLIQTITFAVWPFVIGRPLTRALSTLGFFPQPLLDGVLIMLSLPTTVNMCVILCSTAGGNVATALCNAVLSNLAGIFLTPALLFHFFGSHIQLPFVDMLLKLSTKVLLPVAAGQLLRTTPIKGYCDKQSKLIKRLQEIILLSILWNAFCNAFTESLGLELKHGLGLLALLASMHATAFVILFAFFDRAGFSPGEVVAAVFCSAQKTLAFGLPLVNIVFEGSPNLAAYCAPIMFIHPVSLILGSMFIPRMQVYLAKGKHK